jgi:hypothetical protein
MTTTTFGEVDYSDDAFGGDKKVNSKDLFLHLDDGTNELRLVTAPYQYLVHKHKKDPSNPKDFGQKVNCSMLHGSCPKCAEGDKAKPRWFYGVISRKTGTYKVLDVSYAVFSGIRKLARNPKWGDPTKYDINIEVDRNGGATGYYTVQPIPSEPLSAADQIIKDNADLDDLKRRCTPPTHEQAQKRIDRINGTVSAPGNSSTTKTASVPAVDMSTDTDLEEQFPDYNAATTA